MAVNVGAPAVNIVGYRLVPPDQLLAHPLNARRHPAAQRESLRASLRALGWIAPVVVNLTTGHVVDGHARVKEALSAGAEVVPVVDVELTPEQEALAPAVYDPITSQAIYDREALDSLLREYVRLLAGLQPKAFVLENVSGMVKGKMRLVFVEALQALKAAGYRVSARVLNAMYFGVPQSRERMIFIGVRKDLETLPSLPVAQVRP